MPQIRISHAPCESSECVKALEASLARLGTDYIDIYWMHIWDGVTLVEEIVQTLGDLVRVGKIRYYAFSDMPAWLAAKAATIAAERRVPSPIAMQLEYSLVARDVEGEHFPAARDAEWVSCRGARSQEGSSRASTSVATPVTPVG